MLRNKVEGPDLRGFVDKYCENAVCLWWNEKQRRPEHKGKRKYKKRSSRISKKQRFSNEYFEEFLDTGSSSEDEDDIVSER